MLFSIKFPNSKKWVGDFERLTADMDFETMKKACQMILVEMFAVEKKTFQSQGSFAFHGAWPQINEDYKDWKTRHGYSGAIMIMTGALMKSLTQETPDTIMDVSKTGKTWTLKFGTTVTSKGGFDYPLFHQMGGDIKGSTKTRRTLDPPKQAAVMWNKIIQQEILGTLKRSKAFDKVSINREPQWDKM